MYAGAQEFFTAETLEKVVNWTRRHAVTKKQYVWTGKGIQDKDGWSKEFEIPSPFLDLDPEPLDLIAEYKRAD
jgi:hypothetical protein